jgi:hypothetical protein
MHNLVAAFLEVHCAYLHPCLLKNPFKSMRWSVSCSSFTRRSALLQTVKELEQDVAAKAADLELSRQKMGEASESLTKRLKAMGDLRRVSNDLRNKIIANEALRKVCYFQAEGWDRLRCGVIDTVPLDATLTQ